MTGATGPTGTTGPAGGLATLYYRSASFGLFDSPSQNFGEVSCPASPAGLNVIGGGVLTDSSTPGEQEINSSYPSGTDAWAAFVDNISGGLNGFTVFVICAAAGAVDTGGSLPARPASGNSTSN